MFAEKRENKQLTTQTIHVRMSIAHSAMSTRACTHTDTRTYFVSGDAYCFARRSIFSFSSFNF